MSLGAISYEFLKSLHYLDKCIEETLRIYPSNYRVTRLCEQDTEYGNLKIKKGTVVLIPLYAMQMNPNHFPEPEKFDPDRFALKWRTPTYFPFGLGPRSCPARRIVMISVKLCITHLLTNFTLQPPSGNPAPLKFTSEHKGTLTVPKIQIGIRPL